MDKKIIHDKGLCLAEVNSNHHFFGAIFSAPGSTQRKEGCWYYQALVSQKGTYYRLWENWLKVRVIFLFTLFNNTYEEPEQSIAQSFTSRPKCRHSKIFMKLFIVSANPVQTEDSEAYIWPLLPPKLVFHLTILKGHVIISVSCPSCKIYQVVNPDSRKWQLSQTINFLCLDNFDYLFFKCPEKILLYKP